MTEEYVYCYTGYLTVTNTPQALSAEWGEDTEIDAVDIINPLYLITAAHLGGANVAAESDSTGELLVGGRNAQNRVFIAGGNTGIVGVDKLSDRWVRSRGANDTFRIMFEVYRKKDKDVSE